MRARIDAMDRILTVFDDARATAVLTTMAEAPNLVAEGGRGHAFRTSTLQTDSDLLATGGSTT